MKILVCIKQVPGTTAVEVDEKTGVLKRDGVESKMNPFDLYAIEQALCLEETYGGSVDVITMGPEQAKKVLHEAVYMGADRGILISDRICRRRRCCYQLHVVSGDTKIRYL